MSSDLSPSSPPEASRPASRGLAGVGFLPWIVGALASLDVLDLIAASGVEQHPPESTQPTPPIPHLAAGAPFHTFSVLTSDYFSFTLHWLALCGLALALHMLHRRACRGWGHLAPRLAVGLLLAAGGLAITDTFLVEMHHRFPRYAGHPTRLWTLRPRAGEPGAAEAARSPFGDGFRPTPQTPQAQGTVWVLGDSTTFGVGIDRGRDTYCWLVADLLAQRLPAHPLQVLNRGIPGYTSWQGRVLFDELWASSRPRAVVVGFMANDWTWGRQPDASLEQAGSWGRLRRQLREHPLYLALQASLMGSQRVRIDEPLAASASRGPRVSVTEYEHNLEHIRSSCYSEQIPLVVLCLPMAPCLDEISRPYRDAARRVGSKPGASCLDLHEEWVRQGWNLRDFNGDDPIHPIEHSHAVIAERVATRLLELLCPTSPPRTRTQS